MVDIWIKLNYFCSQEKGVPFWANERRISPLEGMPSQMNSPDNKSSNACLKYFSYTLIINHDLPKNSQDFRQDLKYKRKALF